jgi:D-galactarolactone isomerase
MSHIPLLPKGSCDCHSHLYPPEGAFPMRPGQHHELNADTADYLALCGDLGIERHVLVQGKAYPDWESLLHGIAELGSDRARGIVFYEDSISAADVAILNETNICGFRFLFRAGERIDMESVHAGASLAAGNGWHIIVQAEGPELMDHYDALLALPCPVIVDHIGRPPRGAGADSEAFTALIAFVQGGGWVKLAAPYNLTAAGQSDYTPLADLVRALLQAGSERLVWGLNFPHPNLRADGKPDERATLTSLLGLLTPREIQQIFVENPRLLYRFQQL